MLEFEFSTGLLVDDGRVAGIHLIRDTGESAHVRASAVLLATGGLGQLYRNSTNPPVATGDGVAMAYRAGAEVSDMEFIQFHPTALYVKNAPRFLISEALRGEGAYLRNDEKVRFMSKYHALGELAPRDVVARAIVRELELSRAKDPVVYLDLTHLDGERVKARFPRIYATCLQYNIDITIDMIPIRPAAHYSMGGVRTDLDGLTSLPRPLCRGRSRRHRRAWRQPAGQQFAVGRLGVWSTCRKHDAIGITKISEASRQRSDRRGLERSARGSH